jgi:uncharacterized protein YceH (UPF0502 family)
MTLDPIQQRVLGALIEKEITTPENYPLSLNALLNACNQRSSREPVLDLNEEQVRQALHTLEAHGLTTPNRDARVPKYEHRARTVLNLRRDETAVLCLLLLRGPQTVGELRSRADRLFTFDDLAAVQSTLDRLAARPAAPPAADAQATQPETGPLTVLLPKQPGSSAPRYMHLLGGQVDLADVYYPSAKAETSSSTARIGEMEAQIAELRATVEALQVRLAQLEAESSAR